MPAPSQATSPCGRRKRAAPPKHFITEFTETSFTYERDLEKIATEEELDGLYLVRSNVEPELFDADQTVRAYKDLSKVERAFRSMKTVDLKVRPIYHRRAGLGTGARAVLHAGLLCGVAHAQRVGAGAVR